MTTSERYKTHVAVTVYQVYNTRTHYRELMTKEFKLIPSQVCTTSQGDKKNCLSSFFFFKEYQIFLCFISQSHFLNGVLCVIPSLDFTVGKVGFTDENPGTLTTPDLKQPRDRKRPSQGPMSAGLLLILKGLHGTVSPPSTVHSSGSGYSRGPPNTARSQPDTMHSSQITFA